MVQTRCRCPNCSCRLRCSHCLHCPQCSSRRHRLCKYCSKRISRRRHRRHRRRTKTQKRITGGAYVDAPSYSGDVTTDNNYMYKYNTEIGGGKDALSVSNIVDARLGESLHY
jgi:hypothetical protein